MQLAGWAGQEGLPPVPASLAAGEARQPAADEVAGEVLGGDAGRPALPALAEVSEEGQDDIAQDGRKGQLGRELVQGCLRSRLVEGVELGGARRRARCLRRPRRAGLGSFDEAPNRAFRPLAGYLNGADRSRRRIAMTAPVLQQAAGRPGRYLVQFVMPSHLTAETLPLPQDARVRTREIPRQLAAAVRFSGRWTHKAFEERGAALRRTVAASGLRSAGPMRYARFNPPWTAWFARRNEVVLPVQE